MQLLFTLRGRRYRRLTQHSLPRARYGLTRAGLSPAGLRQQHWRLRFYGLAQEVRHTPVRDLDSLAGRGDATRLPVFLRTPHWIAASQRAHIGHGRCGSWSCDNAAAGSLTSLGCDALCGGRWRTGPLQGRARATENTNCDLNRRENPDTGAYGDVGYGNGKTGRSCGTPRRRRG